MNLTTDIVSEGWHRLVHLSRFDLTQFFATLCKMNMQIRFAVNKVQQLLVLGWRDYTPDHGTPNVVSIHMPHWGTIICDFNLIAKRFLLNGS